MSMDFTLPVTLPAQHNVIGIFSDKNLQTILENASKEVPDGQFGLVAHINGESSNLTLVKRFGTQISIEAVIDYNYKTGFSGEAELKAIF